MKTPNNRRNHTTEAQADSGRTTAQTPARKKQEGLRVYGDIPEDDRTPYDLFVKKLNEKVFEVIEREGSTYQKFCDALANYTPPTQYRDRKTGKREDSYPGEAHISRIRATVKYNEQKEKEETAGKKGTEYKKPYNMRNASMAILFVLGFEYGEKIDELVEECKRLYKGEV